MIILHLGWNKDKLLLWGETSDSEQKIMPKNKNDKKSLKIKPCPFSAPIKKISAALKEIYDVKETGENASPAIVWLPTKNGAPIASNSAIFDKNGTGGKISVKPWLIDTVAFAAEEIIEFLIFSFDEEALPHGVFMGNDFAFWRKAINFAAALAAKQRYIPGLSSEGGVFRAEWEPIFTGSDAEYLKKLADIMPPSALAVSSQDSVDCCPEYAAAEALRKFTAKMVDRIVRIGILEKDGKIKFDSAHDAWIAGLKSQDGAVSGGKSEIVQFSSHLENWRRPIFTSLASPMRLCFRIEEPRETDSNISGNDKRWRVYYLLQGAEDPSILISAEDVWKNVHDKLSFFKVNKFNAKEYLLIALGQAAGISPEIEKSLNTARPYENEFELAGIGKFLTEEAPALEQAGFGVIFPAWWMGRWNKPSLSVNAKIKNPKLHGKSGLSFDQIINFDWELALGDEKLSLRELLELAKLKAPLVKLRGKWVYLNAEEIQNALSFLRKNTEGAVSLREIVKMSLGAVNSVDGIALGAVEAKGKIGELLKNIEDGTGLEQISTPNGFNGILRPYQVRGYSWLAFMRKWRLGACLADDMGLGKTIQALTMIQKDWELKNKKPVLLICPTSVVNNWSKESARFTPTLPIMIHHGADRIKSKKFKTTAQKHAIVISSYSLLHRDIEHLRQIDWSGVILDEAQNIKNPETKQAKSARELKSDYRIALTGTPVENHVGELWSIMEFLNPGLLGAQAEFKRKFFMPIQTGSNPEAVKRLRRITAPFILRRLKTDKSIISDLPEKIETKVFCVLTKEQASLYAAAANEAEKALNEAEGIERKGIILAILLRLKQICNHPAQFLADNSSISNRSGKLQRISEMLEEIIEEDGRALIFTQFTQMGLILKRHLEDTFGRETPFLHGGVARKNRDNMVESFQSDDGPRIFIVSLKAGGTGLNLTRANHVFHFDRWWNPAVENQATDRAFRIGQARNVQVHKFICSGTVEERIDEMIERKTQIASQVVAGGEAWLTEMSNKQLKEIFTLRKEALGD